MDSVEQHLLSLEQKRCEALLAADIPALDKLLSQRLVFTHANAVADTKETFREKMRQGRIVYVRLEVTESRVIELRESAILLCRMTAELLVAGVPKRIDNRTLSIWAIEDGQHSLVAYQPTP